MGPALAMSLMFAFGQVKLAIASVTVWWIVYTCCEVVFVHLHHFPRALLWTALLYFAEGQQPSLQLSAGAFLVAE
jgi:hypothetical protein